MSPQRPEPRPGLPAPYESPWRRLGGDLKAVLASCSLKMRELWRRNAEGDLARPAFWPSALAGVFWPLVLALVLAAALAVGMLLVQRPQPGPAGTAGAGAGVAAGGTPRQEQAASPAADPSSAEALPPPAALEPLDPELGQRPQAGEIQAPEVAAAQPSPVPVQAPAPVQTPVPVQPPEPVVEPSPVLTPEQQLRQALEGGSEGALLIGLEPDPAASLLRLQLAADFEGLPERERLRLAGSWQERARSLGYERLELRSPEGQLLARPARVGSGMILLESSAARR